MTDKTLMENYIYSVEIFEHHIGLQEYYLFSSWQKARDFAEGHMIQREESIDEVFQELGVETDDMVRIWGGSCEDVVIRRKDLMDLMD